MSKISSALISIEYEHLLDDAIVLSEAVEIAISVSRYDKRRTYEQIKEDSRLGLALEHAVVNQLQLNGYDAKRSVNDLTYDILVKIGDDEIRLDIKALRHGRNGKYFSLGQYEFNNAGADTLYLMFDCSLGVAMFEGWVTLDQFRQSNYADYKGRYGGYVCWDDLQDPDELKL
jgi:hypothetical protein